jgi:hypothetical protein
MKIMVLYKGGPTEDGMARALGVSPLGRSMAKALGGCR